MKTKIYFNQLANLFIILILSSCMILTNCKEKEESNMIPDPVLENDYVGSLHIEYTNAFPQWSVSTSMMVHIDKDLGIIDIDNCTLSYSGETIINDDSKIVRSGQWEIIPVGTLMQDAGRNYIDINANVIVQNDVQRIYAKDNNNNWVLVSEVPFNETPYSILSFDFDDAVIMGSVAGVANEYGSITWTLTLSPAIL